MFPLDYNFEKSGMLYKHSVTEFPPCDAFFTHTHNLFEILYFISGDATCIIEDRKYKLKKNDLIFIRPSKYHFIKIDSSVKYERYDVLFPANKIGLDTLSLLPEDIEIINLSSNPVADGIFKKLDYYFENLNQEMFSKVLKLLLGELFFSISITAKNSSTSELSVINPILSKAIKYINANLFTIKSIEEVASNVFVTQSYLFRLFKKELKQSPKKYLTDKRLLVAQNLIHIGESPTKVYLKCGFNDYTTFYKSYKSFFKKAPSKDIYNNV